MTFFPKATPLLFSLFTFFLSQFYFPIVAQETRLCSQQLAPEVDRLLTQPNYNQSHWGIAIATLDDQHPLYNHNNNQYFIPASNVKLLTTAGVLLKLGKDYQIKTPVYLHNNTLTIVAQNDPSLTTANLEQFAQVLHNKQITNLDRVILETPPIPPSNYPLSWEWSDLYTDYGASIYPIILNQNKVSLIVESQSINTPLKWKWSDSIAGQQWKIINESITSEKNTQNTLDIQGKWNENSLTLTGQLPLSTPQENWDFSIPFPDQYFLQTLTEVLKKRGITVQNQQITAPSLHEETPFYQFHSPPLSQLIAETNQNSNNLYAESLYQRVDRPDFLTRLNIASNYHLEDGSGLSRQNLVTPQVFIETLAKMAETPLFSTYYNSLSIAGSTGTLRNRFRNTTIAGNLRGKTGTMNGISALSGYFDPPHYEPLIFSIIVNNSPASNRQLREQVDSIISLLNRLEECR